MDRALTRYVENGQMSGMVTLVARKGKIVHFKGYGVHDVESGKPMETDALFRIASMTKPLVTVAAMLLYEEGYFLLNDPVSKYIPEFANPEVLVYTKEEGHPLKVVPAKSEITIRQLMNHTSGITNGNGLLRNYYEEADLLKTLHYTPGVLKDRMMALAELPLAFHPGEQYTYSLGIEVIGYLIEVISGKDLATFMKERIFDPLGMKDTYFRIPEKAFSRLVPLVQKKDGSKFITDPRSVDFLKERIYYSGSGGLNSTAHDYFKFAQMLLNKGHYNGIRLLSPKTIDLMTTNSIGVFYKTYRANSGDKIGYGFGVRTERGEYDELESLGIYGWDGAFNTRFFIDPQEEIIGIIMTQCRACWPENISRRFTVLTYQAIVE